MATGTGLTNKGYETQIGTNRMGHVLPRHLVYAFLQKVTTSDFNSDVRVISLSSHGKAYAL